MSFVFSLVGKIFTVADFNERQVVEVTLFPIVEGGLHTQDYDLLKIGEVFFSVLYIFEIDCLMCMIALPSSALKIHEVPDF